jgi:hypothetical protein
MNKYNKKKIKNVLLYILILILLIEIIKIRPLNRKYENILEKYTNNKKQQEKKLEKKVKRFSKEQNKLRENLRNHSKYLKIKEVNFAESSFSKILFKNSTYLNNMNKLIYMPEILKI